MKFIYLLIRVPLLFTHVLMGLIILIFFPSNVTNLKAHHHIISLYWMKILIKIFGLNIIQKGNLSESADAYVSNHISFLDIIVLNSLIPSNFVAKSEIKNWPIIGRLSSRTGTIFIKRGDENDIQNVVGIMREYIRMKKKVIFFPEGRIGNGNIVRKFHSKLFNCMSNTRSHVQPIFIRYPIEYPTNNLSDSSVCWADKTQTLAKISLRCLGRTSTNVIVEFKNSIDATKYDAYELAKKTSNLVLESSNDTI